MGMTASIARAVSSDVRTIARALPRVTASQTWPARKSVNRAENPARLTPRPAIVVNRTALPPPLPIERANPRKGTVDRESPLAWYYVLRSRTGSRKAQPAFDSFERQISRVAHRPVGTAQTVN